MGFARVTAVDELSLQLEWEENGRRLPTRLSQDAAVKAYRRCQPDGFFARSLLDGAHLRTLLVQDPIALVLLLLNELGGPREMEELEQWLLTRGIIAAEDRPGLWARIGADMDPRLEQDGTRIRANDQLTGPLPPAPAVTGWNQLPAVEGLEVLRVGAELLELLARHHLQGQGVDLSAHRVTLDEQGALQLDPGRGRMSEDMHQAGLLILRRVLGRPLPGDCSPDTVLSYLSGVVRPLPPAAMPLLEELLSPSPSLRPRNALRPAADWAAALATERLRAHPGQGADVRVRYGVDTHVGRYKMRDHQTNQDAFGVEESGEAAIYIVADGISTSDAGTGDLAARIAVEVIEGLWDRRPDDLSDRDVARAYLTEVLSAANRRVCERALEEAGGDLYGRIPMGTTVVAALVQGDVVDLVNLGDSRIYLSGQAGTALLTADQNVELEWIQGRRSRAEDGEMLGQALIGYLGHFDDEDSPTLLPVWHRRLRLMDSETLLLCSDGIVDYAAPSHLEFIRLVSRTVEQYSPAAAAQALVRAANEGGGGDNATAMVLRLNMRG